jgi:aldehyde:ferredoxin oxidoreductase
LRTAILDLGRKTCEYREIEPDLARAFIGGRGIGTKLFFDMTPPRVDPLSPSCPVVFSSGPLTGTPFPMGGRFTVTSKSPLTGTIFTSTCGGRMGACLRKNGIDALVLTGSGEEPLYISIEGGEIAITNAKDLWGKEKAPVKERLRERHGRDVSILLIGKAGERGVPFANIENDGLFFGRGGLGAVLGAKHVKAIVVKGKGKVAIPDREQFSFVSYECRKWLAANPVTSKGLPEFGTGILLNYMRESGLLWERNFRFPAPPESSSLSGEALTATILTKKRACLFCPVACGRVTREGIGPDYESLWSLGVNLCIHDVAMVARLNGLCNDLGLDPISTGNVIGMAIELSEGNGRMKVRASYGDATAAGEIISRIAERDGEGAALSLGVKKLGEMFDARDIAAHCKGMELPAYDPRGAYGNALGYATSNRGGCHTQGYLVGAEMLGTTNRQARRSPAGKANLLAVNQNIDAFMDTLVMCRYSSFAIPHDYYSRIASAVTGEKITWEESMTIGERIWNLERLFNLREGIDEDTLPARFAEIPIEEMRNEYYEIRGWDKAGRPGREKLNKLGLL